MAPSTANIIESKAMRNPACGSRRRSRRLLGISAPELWSSPSSSVRRSPRLRGRMANHESPSRRKGPRLLGKSASTIPQRSQIKPSKPTEPCNNMDPGKSTNTISQRSQIASPKPGYSYYGSAFVRKFSDIAKVKRFGRRGNAIQFRHGYTYRTTEYRNVIWSGQAHSWSENSYGITWVAVHGVNSIFVVTRNEIPDVTRFGDPLSESLVIKDFGKTIISEMEDLVHSPSTFPERVDLSNEKPFAVVSVTPKTNDVHEENCHEEYNEKGALDFLLEKIKEDSTFTPTETAQIAITAFQHLCRQGFNAKEIRVFELRHDCILDLFPSSIHNHLASIPGSSVKEGSTEEYTFDDGLPMFFPSSSDSD